jgi:hypothetical protein
MQNPIANAVSLLGNRLVHKIDTVNNRGDVVIKLM